MMSTEIGYGLKYYGKCGYSPAGTNRQVTAMVNLHKKKCEMCQNGKLDSNVRTADIKDVLKLSGFNHKNLNRRDNKNHHKESKEKENTKLLISNLT